MKGAARGTGSGLAPSTRNFPWRGVQTAGQSEYLSAANPLFGARSMGRRRCRAPREFSVKALGAILKCGPDARVLLTVLTGPALTLGLACEGSRFADPVSFGVTQRQST